MAPGRFSLNIGKNFFSEGVVQPRAAVESPSLEALSSRADVVLGDEVQWWAWQRQGSSWT